MLISIIGNTLVLAAILITPSLRSPSTILLCSLAVSDLLVGLVVQPNYIAAFRLKNVSLYRAAETMAFVECAVSLNNDSHSCGSVFGSSLSHAISEFNDNKSRHLSIGNSLDRYHFVINSNYFRRACLCSHYSCWYCYLPFKLFLFYIKIYLIVRHRQIQIQVQQQAVVSINTENYSNIQKSKKSAPNTFIYFIVMIQCYIPLVISR